MPHIVISISEQSLKLLSEDGSLMKQYCISSGAKGTGSLAGSGKTPLGKHVIRAKIGNNMPSHSVFVGRRWTGEVHTKTLSAEYPTRDWILTRILWLSGLEVGINRLGDVDTMRRYIYIHGTPDVEPMGVPLSHGCIRMRNSDILDLFDRVASGTLVNIVL